MSTSQREKDRERIAGAILEEICKAKCFYHIERASSALFHMNLLWDSYNKESKRFEDENDFRTCEVTGGK